MSTPDDIPRPPAMAAVPSAESLAPDAGTREVFRNTHDAPDSDTPPAPEPTREQIPGRDFAGAGSFAADQRRQREERDAGLGGGGTDNRDARRPPPTDGEVPTDDMD